MANTKITSNVISDDINLGGNPTTTTQSAGNNTTRIATTAFVKAAIDATIDSAPGALDTLNELAAAIGDDANFSTTVTNSIATKAPLDSPVFSSTYTSGQDEALAEFRRDGGAVAAKIIYADATTDMEFGTTTSHSLSLITADTRRLTINSSGNATFTGTITANGGSLSELLIRSTGKLRIGTDQTWASNVSGQIRLAYDGDERSITGSYDDGMVIRTNSYQLKLATDGVLHIPANVQSAGAVIVGGTAVDQAGTISLQTDGDIRGVLTSGAGGDTIISAISGVSNGYQITVDSSNNQTYKWHNGGAASMTLNSSGRLGVGMTPGSYGMLQVALSTNDSYSAGSFLDFPTVTLQHTAGDGYYGGIRLTNTSGNYEWFMGTTQVASNQADFVWQGYNRTAGAYQEMMRLTDDSKLGIGTTDPSAPIHIQTNTAETDDGVTGLMLTALSTGTTIAGFGPRLQFQAERNNGVNQNVGLLSFLASTNSGTNISSDFVVHCGTAGVNNERFRVRHDGGEVTIKAPATNAYYPYLHLRNYSSGAYSGRINFWTKNAGVEWVAASIFTTGGSGYQSGSLSGGMRLYVRGQFGDSAAINAIDINGNTGVASGDFNDTSDVALKKDVVSLDGGESLKAIKALNPVSFKWKLDDRESSGFIAQEVEKHLPNDVVGEDWKAEDAEKDEEGSKGKAINTAGILAHAVKVIQDQQVIIDDLKTRIEALEG